MRKLLFAVIFLFIGSFNLAAQNKLAWVDGQGQETSLRATPIQESDKYKNAKAIYDRLVSARGDYRFPAPKFTMSRATKYGAYMDYDSCEITLEENAYDVCASFGEQRDQALAIILGHELIHYYEKHGWRVGFSNEYMQLKIGTKLSTVQDFVTHETQADYLGGFLAYSAGFGLFDKCPNLIEGLYKSYKLPDSMPKYPIRQDREALSKHTVDKLELLVDVFETANLLTAIGKYGQAKLYYQHVLKDYQSREIFNNIGVMLLLEVLDNEKRKWFYPVELDLSFRASRGNDGFASRKNAMLLEAIKNFDFAINMDPDYAPAFLNKACAYALLNDFSRAQFYAETEAYQKAKLHGFTKTESDVAVLSGILAYERGDSSTAQAKFEKEIKNKNTLAELNLKRLLRQPDEKPEENLMPGISKSEKIGGISLASFAQDPQWDKSKVQKIDSKTILFQHKVPDDNSKIYICRDDSGDETALTFFHTTTSGTTSVPIGASKEDIIKAYKKPVKVISTPQGEIMVYKRMIFILNVAGKLEKWANYQLP